MREFTVEGEFAGVGWFDTFNVTPISADGQRMLTWEDSEVCVWNARTGEALSKFGEPDTIIYTATISEYGRLALVGTNDGRARLWDVDNRTVLRTFDHGRENRGGELLVNLSPNGRQAVTALGVHSFTQTAQLWDISDLVGPHIKIQLTEKGLKLIWSSGVLQVAENVNGPWLDVSAAESPHVIPPSEKREFFRAIRD